MTVISKTGWVINPANDHNNIEKNRYSAHYTTLNLSFVIFLKTFKYIFYIIYFKGNVPVEGVFTVDFNSNNKQLLSKSNRVK